MHVCVLFLFLPFSCVFFRLNPPPLALPFRVEDEARTWQAFAKVRSESRWLGATPAPPASMSAVITACMFCRVGGVALSTAAEADRYTMTMLIDHLLGRGPASVLPGPGVMCRFKDWSDVKSQRHGSKNSIHT